MSATIRADGDTWRAELGGRENARLVLFFCETTDQRPYRVVELEEGDSAGTEGLETLEPDGLRALFDRSRSMGAPKDYPTYGA